MIYKILSLISAIFFIFFSILFFYELGQKSIPVDTSNIVSTSIKDETVIEKIVRMSHVYNFDQETALRIAKCESQYGKYKVNWQGSSAKGVYMFTDGTWSKYCEGDVMNDTDNIKCFLKLYNQHKSWWECG